MNCHFSQAGVQWVGCGTQEVEVDQFLGESKGASKRGKEASNTYLGFISPCTVLIVRETHRDLYSHIVQYLRGCFYQLISNSISNI